LSSENLDGLHPGFPWLLVNVHFKHV